MSKRIVITGIGVLACNGIGRDAFWNGLEEGRSGVREVSLFDTSTTRSKLAGEIADFNPKAILGPKGLRTLDRTTLLVLCASKFAFEDANLPHPVSGEDTNHYGVSLGSTMGSVWSISEFDKLTLREGPRAVNPAHFPNTVINSPASHISIRFNIQGFNSTISTGFCSSLDAVYYAMNMINLYGYEVVLTGGVEELCEQTYKGFYLPIPDQLKPSGHSRCFGQGGCFHLNKPNHSSRFSGVAATIGGGIQTLCTQPLAT